MAEENVTPSTIDAGKQNEQAQLVIQKIFLKDASFETPNSPAIFQEKGETKINLNLSQKVNNIAEHIYEVILTITVTAKLGEKTAYLAEIQQGGLFAVKGFEQPQLNAVIGSYCPQVLFPYARSVATQLVSQGGFPPLILQHVDFNAVYAQHVEKQKAAAATPESASQTSH